MRVIAVTRYVHTSEETTQATVNARSAVILAASTRATAVVKVAGMGAENTQVIAAARNAAISANPASPSKSIWQYSSTHQE